MRRVTMWLGMVCAAFIAACAPAPQNNGPALWRLADADSEIYLLGTVHVLPATLQWKSARMVEAFQRADVVWFETPTDEAAARKIAAIVARTGLNPPGLTLSSQLAPQDRARLLRVAASVGVAPQTLEPLRPWLAGLQLSLALLNKKGHTPDAGVEHALAVDAAALGKPIAYFETAEEQMAIFATLSPQAERDFLTTTLRQIEEDADDTETLNRLWASGDTVELDRLIAQLTDEAGPEVAEALIYARNARFAARIDTLMNGKGRIFVAVGAAHMTGERGLPAQLRARGYAVEGP